jgi:hypothetical protein
MVVRQKKKKIEKITKEMKEKMMKVKVTLILLKEEGNLIQMEEMVRLIQMEEDNLIQIIDNSIHVKEEDKSMNISTPIEKIKKFHQIMGRVTSSRTRRSLISSLRISLGRYKAISANSNRNSSLIVSISNKERFHQVGTMR